MLFLGLLEEGLKLAREVGRDPALPPEPKQPSLIEQLYEGEDTEFLMWKEEDGTAGEQPRKETFRHLILPINQELPTLYDSLCSTVCGEAEYKTPRGATVMARKCLWITRLPPLIMFQENRVHINPKTKL
jgi:hypothetical protein